MLQNLLNWVWGMTVWYTQKDNPLCLSRCSIGMQSYGCQGCNVFTV